MKFRVWDKEKQEFWKEEFTLLELAKSHKFPSNIEQRYDIVSVNKAIQAELLPCVECGGELAHTQKCQHAYVHNPQSA